MNYEKELRELNLMQQIYAAIFSLANKIQVQADKRLERLTARQFMTLTALLHLSQEEATISRIAAKMGTTKQNACSIIAGLEKKKIVETSPSPSDKRAVNVKLTGTGEKALSFAGEKSILFLADLFTDLSESELELLWKLLKKLYPFDGQPQDGYEEDAAPRIAKAGREEEIRLLSEFRRRRAGKEKTL